jgi:HlyD family secretion protein
MKKKKTIITIAVIIVVAAATLIIFRPFGKKVLAYTFDTAKVERGNITNTVTATGTIEAVTSVDVGTQVSGILQHVYADFNDVVKQGQLLAKLDEVPLKAQVDQSQASVDQAQAQLNYQEATYNRLKVLYEKKLIAQSDYDQALYNYESARATLSNAKSALSRAKVNLAYATITSPIDGVVLNRAVEEGQTVAASFNTPTLFTIVNDLTQMEVQTNVDEADIGKVRQGQRVEFTVDAYPDLKFEGTVSEVRLQPVITNNVVTYVVILNAPNPDKKLMPGMTASATIFIEEKENTLILTGKAIRFTPDAAYLQQLFASMPKPPGVAAGAMGQGEARAASAQGGSQALAGQGFSSGQMPQGMPSGGLGRFGNSPDKKMVWVKNDKGGIRPQPVTIGIDNGNNVEIVSGLNEGDEVVISMNSESKTYTTRQTNNRPRGPFPF